MKQATRILCIATLLIWGIPQCAYSQLKVGGESSESLPSFSYATAYLRIDPKSNEVHSTIIGAFRQVTIHFPDGTNPQLTAQCNEFIKTLKYSNELLNWMGQRGWRLLSSEVMEPIEKGGITYLQILIFEKEN